MKYGTITRDTASMITDALNITIATKKVEIEKARNLELSEFNLMLMRYLIKELKSVENLHENMLNFSRSFEFGKQYYDDNLRPIIKADVRMMLERAA